LPAIPFAITVSATIKVGLFCSTFAFLNAASKSEKLLPSTSEITCQLADSNLFLISSIKDRVSPFFI